MTSIELCRMCTEYSADTRCEHKKDCKLQKILTENRAEIAFIVGGIKGMDKVQNTLRKRYNN